MYKRQGLDADDGSFVWLPTLEVLHLQDNCLESLGGRWSLAGCPLLRSFDASFNQLRAPDEIAACLQACGDLREVRLHDNPASTCENYADSIALSCPLVSSTRVVNLCCIGYRVNLAARGQEQWLPL